MQREWTGPKLCACTCVGALLLLAGYATPTPQASITPLAKVTSTASTEPTPAPETAPTAPPLIESAVIGASVDGHNIDAYRIGNGEHRVLIVGGIHGNEYGADVAQAFLDDLLGSPEIVAEGTEVHVIPQLNPDGYVRDERGNTNGVDLNLNMPSENWVRDLDPHTRAYASGLNGGTAPGSEPETRAFVDYLDREFSLVISLHSKGGIIDWDGEAGEQIAREMSRISGMPAQHLAVQPYATGTMGQYVPETWGIPVITIELASPDLNASLSEALFAAIEMSRP